MMPDGDYRIEVIPQEPDTIIIVLPAPVCGDTSDAAVDAVARRIYDVLFTDGVGAISFRTRSSPGFCGTCGPSGRRPRRSASSAPVWAFKEPCA